MFSFLLELTPTSEVALAYILWLYAYTSFLSAFCECLEPSVMTFFDVPMSSSSNRPSTCRTRYMRAKDWTVIVASFGFIIGACSTGSFHLPLVSPTNYYNEIVNRQNAISGCAGTLRSARSAGTLCRHKIHPAGGRRARNFFRVSSLPLGPTRPD